MKKLVPGVRRVLLSFAGNEAFYMFFAFITASESLLYMSPLYWYSPLIDVISSYVVAPWGAALCLLRLERRVRIDETGSRADLTLLFLLLMWLLFPFVYRFGPTAKNMICWSNFMILFFGVFASVTEVDSRSFERILDSATMLFAALGLVLGVCALYSAATVQKLFYDGYTPGAIGFGLTDDMPNMLNYGLHYNISAMISVCCALFALAGFCRSKNAPARLLYLISFAAQLLVVVLSQSRTSRYAMLIALAVGLYGLLNGRLPVTRSAARHAVAIACSLVFLVAGFAGARLLTNLALEHYETVRGERLALEAAQSQPPASDAVEMPSDPGEAFESEASPAVQDAANTDFLVTRAAAEEDSTVTQRAAIDSTFSQRTIIWQNLLNYWQENPKRLLIGNGMQQTGTLIVEGLDAVTIPVHNAYLQFIADYGLIGFVLLAAFLCLQVPRALRVLCAPKALSKPGDRVFVMLVVAQCMIGLMESVPLAPMSGQSCVLFFSLAAVFVRDRQLREASRAQ